MLEPEGSHQQRGEADGDRQRIALEHSRRVCSVESRRSADEGSPEIPSRVVILYKVLSRRRRHSMNLTKERSEKRQRFSHR